MGTTLSNRAAKSGNRDELSKALNETTKKDSYSTSTVARRAVAGSILVAVMGLTFLAGMKLATTPISVGQPTQKMEVTTNGVPSEQFSTDIAIIHTSLEKIINRQDVLKSAIATRPAPKKAEEPKKAEKPVKTIEDKYNDRMKEARYSQLLSLEDKRAALVTAEYELIGQGLARLHPKVRSITGSLNGIDQRIRQVKQDLGFQNK